jgi:hypothetical protein
VGTEKHADLLFTHRYHPQPHSTKLHFIVRRFVSRCALAFFYQKEKPNWHWLHNKAYAQLRRSSPRPRRSEFYLSCDWGSYLSEKKNVRFPRYFLIFVPKAFKENVGCLELNISAFSFFGTSRRDFQHHLGTFHPIMLRAFLTIRKVSFCHLFSLLIFNFSRTLSLISTL